MRELLKKFSSIRSDGNILPIPVLAVDAVAFPLPQIDIFIETAIAKKRPVPVSALVENGNGEAIFSFRLITAFEAKVALSHLEIEESHIGGLIRSLELTRPTTNHMLALCDKFAKAEFFGRTDFLFLNKGSGGRKLIITQVCWGSNRSGSGFVLSQFRVCS